MVLSCIARRAFKINEMQMRADEQHLIGKCQNMFETFTFRSIWQTLLGYAFGCWLLTANCWREGRGFFMCRLGQQSPDKLCMYVASAACALKNLYKVLNVPCHGTEWQLQGGASTLLALWQYLKRVMEYSTNTDNMSQSHNPARPGPGQAMPGQDGTDQARPADNALIPCLQSAQVQILSGHSQ